MPETSSAPALDEDQSTKMERTNGVTDTSTIDFGGSPAIPYFERAQATAQARQEVTGDAGVPRVPSAAAANRDNAFQDFGAPAPVEPKYPGGTAGPGDSPDVAEKAPYQTPSAGETGPSFKDDSGEASVPQSTDEVADDDNVVEPAAEGTDPNRGTQPAV
jgi:hypothetical protein